MKTTLDGQFEPTFYKNIDLDGMLNYLLNIRKFQNHKARSLVNYFRRYRDIFFGPDPAEVDATQEIMDFTGNPTLWKLRMKHYIIILSQQTRKVND